jgi:hypothetical protein
MSKHITWIIVSGSQLHRIGGKNAQLVLSVPSQLKTPIGTKRSQRYKTIQEKRRSPRSLSQSGDARGAGAVVLW